MPRGKKNVEKDPFEELDDEFKSSIIAMGVTDIRDRIASISIAQAELMEAKDADIDFQKAKETAKEAGAIYRDGTRVNKLKVAFARRVLQDRGKA